MRYFYAASVALFILSPHTLSATGTSGAEFLNLGIGARPVALGEAFSAAIDDPMTMHYNPAGLATMLDQKLSFSHNEFVENLRLSYIGATYPLFSTMPAVVGVSLYYFSARNIYIFISLTEGLDIVGNMPTFFNRSVVGKRRHWCPVNACGKGSENIFNVIGILPTATEITTFMPICWLN